MAYLQHAAKVLTTSQQDGGGGLCGGQHGAGAEELDAGFGLGKFGLLE